MATLVVAGGSMIGLATAMMLARDGHEVTVLERDPAPVPDSPTDAWATWERPGVPQVRQAHLLLPRSQVVLAAELPFLLDRMTDAGCVWHDLLAALPPPIQDRAPRPGDDRFKSLTGRRPVFEATFARAASEHPGVTVRRGVGVAELLAGDAVIDGAPHVVGVRTTDGDEIRADLVVDATGRRTKLTDWLRPLGAREPHVESEDSGFVYYTRFFTGELPAYPGRPTAPFGSISLLTLPGDNNTWSVTIYAAAADVQMRAAKDPDKFDAVVRACPSVSHWISGEPITDVAAMAGIADRYRRFVVDDQPIATGVCAVGDAWSCTNPSAGRGVSVGLAHAQLLRDATRTSLDDPEGFAREFDALTERDVAPFVHHQISTDRARLAEMDALRTGEEPPPPNPVTAKVFTALAYDPDVFRAVMEIVSCLTLPDELPTRPGFIDKVMEHGDKPAPPATGPDRAELERLLA